MRGASGCIGRRCLGGRSRHGHECRTPPRPVAMTGELEPALWIRNPLGILADNAAGGVVVRDGKIEQLIPSGEQPTAQDAVVFDAGAHVVLPGLINTHHHFYQTLTRAAPEALDRPLFGWLTALYPNWARLTPDA